MSRNTRLLLPVLLAFATTLPHAAWAAVGPTVTSLALSPASPIASPAAVTLTATVSFIAGGAPVTAGTVIFCDATAIYCEDVTIVGRAQLNPHTGAARLKIIPAIGTHSYKAIFSATNVAESSTSHTQTLTVTGLYPTTTAIASSGNPSGYGLAATVVGFANNPPLLTGTVSFQDTTNGNYVLGTASLGTPAVARSFMQPPGSPIATGVNPAAAAVGDFNGDGITDLAVMDSGQNALTILLGNGDGTFKPPNILFGVGTAPCILPTQASNCAIAVGDFNNDGIADLAVTSGGDNTIVILLGNGDGTFIATSGSPIPVGNFPEAVKVGDFNNDGLLDLAVANGEDNTVSILLGNGDGTFTPATGSPIAVGQFPFFLAVASFTPSGNADLAVVNDQDNTVSILLGNGDGTFTQAAGSPIPGFNYNPSPIVAADFNRDGKVDLAVANFTSANPAIPVGNVVVLLGNGDGTFTAASGSPVSVGFQPFAMVAGDFNLDGKTDLAVDNYGDQNLTLLLGDGNGGFTASGPPTPLGDSPNDLVTADFNGDGTPDLAIPELGDNNITILLDEFTQTATAAIANVTIAGTGTHYVDAAYSGNTYFAPSVSTTIPLQGSTVSTTLTLSANPTQQLVTMPVTFTAQIASSSNEPSVVTPTGTISFFDGGVLLGTAAVSATGQAVYSTSGLADGAHSITANYGGDPNFLPSTTSSALSITISDLQVTRSGSSTPIILPGATVSYVFQVAPVVASTFLYNVTLAASGLPAGATASFSTATLPAGGSASSVTLTVTTAGSAALSPPVSPPFPRLALALGLLLPLSGALRASRRMRWNMLSVLLFQAVILSAVMGLSGCSGAGIFAEKKISYAITVTATSDTLQRSSTVPLVIQ
jgi:hypothetical protein